VNERFIGGIEEQDGEDNVEGRIELVTALVASSESIE
jgi:hypothetical protein